MPDGSQIDFAAQIETVARRLYGEPNRKLSNPKQLRFGSRGSLAVEIRGDNRGTWFDHENQIGGGVLDLIEHQLGLVNGEAIEWLTREVMGRAAEPKTSAKSGRRMVATYDYQDEDGNLLYQVVRFDPKDFRQRRPDGKGGWLWNLGGVRIVPYRLPTFANAAPTVICIVEGEKDVEALRRLGFVATCNPGGAGKWQDHFAEHFAGWQVVILPDNDVAGRKHALQVARNLAPVAEMVRIIELPGMPAKGDVSDWLEAGGTPKQLCDLVAATEPFDPAKTTKHDHAPKSKRTTAADVWGMSFDPLRWTVEGYLPEGLSILAGRQKLGKTWLALDFAIAVAIGGAAFGNISVSQGDVLFFDLENGMRRFRRRLDTLYPYPPVRPDLSRLEYRDRAPELGDEFIAECEEWRRSVEKPALIVVDVLQRIKPAGRASRNSYENDYSALADLQRWATEHGVSVLVLHHTRKGGADDPLEALSGSNGLSACADTTLVLDRTAAGLTLYFRGRDVEERETALKFDNGLFSILGDADEWKRSGERSAILRVLKEADEPMGPGELAAASGMPGNNVRKLLFGMTKDQQVKRVGRGKYIHPDRIDLAVGAGADDNVVEFASARRERGNNGNNGNIAAKGKETRGHPDASDVTALRPAGNVRRDVTAAEVPGNNQGSENATVSAGPGADVTNVTDVTGHREPDKIAGITVWDGREDTLADLPVPASLDKGALTAWEAIIQSNIRTHALSENREATTRFHRWADAIADELWRRNYE